MKYYYIILILFLTTTGYSQNFIPDATIWEDPWISCQKTMNPKKEYGVTHWIQYDLGHIRRLSKTWVWNVNTPDKLEQGFREVKVDYSRNGIEWESLGSLTFPKGTGSAIYSGFEGPDLLDIKARFVLLTVVSTYGDGNCAGISEIKFNLRPPLLEEGTAVVTELPNDHNNLLLLYPNPAQNQIQVRTIYDGPTTFTVFTLDGRLVYQRVLTTSPNQEVVLNTSLLLSGMYILQVKNNGYQSIKRFVIN